MSIQCIQFTKDSKEGKILAEFLQEDIAKHSGTRSELRRCRSATEVMMTPSYYRLRQKFQSLPIANSPHINKRLAIITGLMSHLAKNQDSINTALYSLPDDKSYIYLLVEPWAKPKEASGSPRLSELRFRRLLQRDIDDLYLALVRILRMLDGKANLYGLAESVFYWNEITKRKWAEAYFTNLKT